MKKSLLALAALTAFAGAASAQSSVTLYGRIDLSVAKNIGSDNKNLQNGSGSRLGVRGVEDLGGGLKVDFNLEHRYNADDGNLSSSRFWHGRSVVGLRGGFGRVSLGREYTPAFLYAQLSVDPWGWDTVAAFTSAGGGIVKVRQDNTVNYQIGGGGFNLWAQIAESANTAAEPDRPFSIAANYSAGPMYIAFGHENPGNVNDDWNYLNFNYNFGGFKLLTGLGSGKNAGNQTHRQYMVGATAAMGAGEFRAAFAQLKNTTTDVTLSQKFAVGYHYSMSKRTTLYVDFANDSKAARSKSGYDLGIKHNF